MCSVSLHLIQHINYIFEYLTFALLCAVRCHFVANSHFQHYQAARKCRLIDCSAISFICAGGGTCVFAKRTTATLCAAAVPAFLRRGKRRKHERIDCEGEKVAAHIFRPLVSFARLNSVETQRTTETYARIRRATENRIYVIALRT